MFCCGNTISRNHFKSLHTQLREARSEYSDFRIKASAAERETKYLKGRDLMELDEGELGRYNTIHRDNLKVTQVLLALSLDCCLPSVSTTVCLSQLLSACLNYCLPVSTNTARPFQLHRRD